MAKKCKKCNKTASFGVLSDTPEFCKEHKKKEDVNVRKFICDVYNCTKKANYCEKHVAIPTRCKQHKTDIMRHFYVSVCNVGDCVNKADYMTVDSSRFDACEAHKTLNATRRNQPVSKRCHFVGTVCYKVAHFSEYPGGDKYCKNHALPGMVNYMARFCAYVNCMTTVPHYNMHCKKHSVEPSDGKNHSV